MICERCGLEKAAARVTVSPATAGKAEVKQVWCKKCVQAALTKNPDLHPRAPSGSSAGNIGDAAGSKGFTSSNAPKGSGRLAESAVSPREPVGAVVSPRRNTVATGSAVSSKMCEQCLERRATKKLTMTNGSKVKVCDECMLSFHSAAGAPMIKSPRQAGADQGTRPSTGAAAAGASSSLAPPADRHRPQLRRSYNVSSQLADNVADSVSQVRAVRQSQEQGRSPRYEMAHSSSSAKTADGDSDDDLVPMRAAVHQAPPPARTGSPSLAESRTTGSRGSSLSTASAPGANDHKAAASAGGSTARPAKQARLCSVCRTAKATKKVSVPGRAETQLACDACIPHIRRAELVRQWGEKSEQERKTWWQSSTVDEGTRKILRECFPDIDSLYAVAAVSSSKKTSNDHQESDSDDDQPPPPPPLSDDMSDADKGVLSTINPRLAAAAKKLTKRQSARRAAAPRQEPAFSSFSKVPEKQIDGDLPPLPPGWLATVSKKTGKMYYFNEQTKQTSWTRPTASVSGRGRGRGGRGGRGKILSGRGRGTQPNPRAVPSPIQNKTTNSNAQRRIASSSKPPSPPPVPADDSDEDSLNAYKDLSDDDEPPPPPPPLSQLEQVTEDNQLPRGRDGDTVVESSSSDGDESAPPPPPAGLGGSDDDDDDDDDDDIAPLPPAIPSEDEEESSSDLAAKKERERQQRMQTEQAKKLQAEQEEKAKIQAAEKEKARLRAQEEEEEQARLRVQEEEKARQEEEEEKARLRAQEEEKLRVAAEERKRKEAEALRLREEEQKRKEAEALRIIEEEKKKRREKEIQARLEREQLEARLEKERNERELQAKVSEQEAENARLEMEAVRLEKEKEAKLREEAEQKLRDAEEARLHALNEERERMAQSEAQMKAELEKEKEKLRLEMEKAKEETLKALKAAEEARAEAAQRKAAADQLLEEQKKARELEEQKAAEERAKLMEMERRASEDHARLIQEQENRIREIAEKAKVEAREQMMAEAKEKEQAAMLSVKKNAEKPVATKPRRESRQGTATISNDEQAKIDQALTLHHAGKRDQVKILLKTMSKESRDLFRMSVKQGRKPATPAIEDGGSVEEESNASAAVDEEDNDMDDDDTDPLGPNACSDLVSFARRTQSTSVECVLRLWVTAADESKFQLFLDKSVTPRFPSGLTVDRASRSASLDDEDSDDSDNASSSPAGSVVRLYLVGLARDAGLMREIASDFVLAFPGSPVPRARCTNIFFVPRQRAPLLSELAMQRANMRRGTGQLELEAHFYASLGKSVTDELLSQTLRTCFPAGSSSHWSSLSLRVRDCRGQRFVEKTGKLKHIARAAVVVARCVASAEAVERLAQAQDKLQQLWSIPMIMCLVTLQPPRYQALADSVSDAVTTNLTAGTGSSSSSVVSSSPSSSQSRTSSSPASRGSAVTSSSSSAAVDRKRSKRRDSSTSSSSPSSLAAVPDQSTRDPLEIYELSKCLGRGASGTVWAAKDRRSGQMVAVKRLPLLSAATAAECAKEIALMKPLKSSFVVQYIGHYETDMGGADLAALDAGSSKKDEKKKKKRKKRDDEKKELWLILELCARGSIARALDLAPARRFKLPVIASVAKGIALGLNYLHGLGIVHRDVKPENVLVGSQGELKLADFGISSTLDEQSKMNTLVGTPQYLAPEVVCAGEAGYGEKVDIWGLGMCCIEMADGTPMFAEVTAMKALFLLADPKLKASVRDRSQWPKLFLSFLDCCMKNSPENRSSAAALLTHDFILDDSVKPVLPPEIQSGEAEDHDSGDESS